MSNANNTWFQGFGGAAARKGGSYLQAGIYLTEVACFSRHKSADPRTLNHEMGIIEVYVRKVIQAYPETRDPATGAVVFGASNREGERASSVQNATKHTSTALGNMKAFLLASLQRRCLVTGAELVQEGTYSPDVWQSLILQATEPPGTMLAGSWLLCYASRTQTRAKQPFTALRWEPAPLSMVDAQGRIAAVPASPPAGA